MHFATPVPRFTFRSLSVNFQVCFSLLEQGTTIGCITNSTREDASHPNLAVRLIYVDIKKNSSLGLKAFSMLELHCTLALKQTLLHL